MRGLRHAPPYADDRKQCITGGKTYCFALDHSSRLTNRFCGWRSSTTGIVFATSWLTNGKSTAWKKLLVLCSRNTREQARKFTKGVSTSAQGNAGCRS